MFSSSRTIVSIVSPCNLVALGISIALGIGAAGAAEPARSTAPIAQYWMDVATFNMMGMEDMPEMNGLSGMFARKMMQNSAQNTTSATGRDGRHAKGVGNFGETKSAAMGRHLDIALYTQRKPEGTQATQTVPRGAEVGASPLHLVTPPREGLVGGSDPVYPERPKGRILFYWGCSAQVKPGQPRILDMSKLGEQDYRGFMQGRSVPDRGARAEPGYAIWPNDRENANVERGASLAGEHVVSGEGVPASMKFTLGREQDFMPPFRVESKGKLAEAIHVSWETIPSARAYMLTALSGGKDGASGGPELVIWSSSEPPESGAGLIDYVSNGNIDKWLGEHVLLPTSQTQCDIPAGIFAKSDAAMLRAIAYGNELNIAYPPKPANPATPWNPEWAVRVRNKSVAMNVLGQEMPAHRSRGEQRGERGERDAQRRDDDKEQKRGPVDAIKGIFGH